jgi:hypothetical protein
MKNAKLAAVALLTIMFAGVVSAGPPRSVTWDKTKDFSNTTHTIRVTYDYIDYGNGTGNKVIIAKGFQILVGSAVGVVGDASDISKTGRTLFNSGTAATGLTVILDVVNGNNDLDFTNPNHYSVIEGITLN